MRYIVASILCLSLIGCGPVGKTRAQIEKGITYMTPSRLESEQP